MESSSNYYQPEQLEGVFNAAQLMGARNRVTLAPSIVRRIATLAGYAKVPAFDSNGDHVPLPEVVDASDLTELLILSGLDGVELQPNSDFQRQIDRAKDILRRILSNRAPTREEIHNQLPSQTVALFRMPEARLSGGVVSEVVPSDVERIIPDKILDTPQGPGETPTQAWVAKHIADVVDMPGTGEQIDPSYRTPINPETGHRSQRPRLGMSLSDGPDQVFSAARGMWSINPEISYIVPSRFGWCPYVYRIPEGAWKPEDPEFAPPMRAGRTRYIAERGYWIDIRNDRLVEMTIPEEPGAWLPQMTVSSEPLTDDDRQIATVLTDTVVRLGVASKNPVIRLRQKGRRLF